MTDHNLLIRSYRPTKRGYRITYSCSVCHAAGDLTTVTRDAALYLHALLQEKHRELKREVAS